MCDKEVIIGLVPSKSNGYRISRNRLYKTKALMDFEEAFALQCRKYKGKMITWFEFELNVYYPNNRSDLDGSFKVILDCLQKVGAIENDNKCLGIVARKFLDKKNPRIEFKIKEVEAHC